MRHEARNHTGPVWIPCFELGATGEITSASNQDIESLAPENDYSFSELCSLACRRSLVLRGLKFSLVVGPILVAINQGDVILAGGFGPQTYLKIGLTFVVPYAVSVFSSVASIRSRDRRNLTE